MDLHTLSLVPLTIAYVFDRKVGEWPRAMHPVVGLGRVIQAARAWAPSDHHKAASFGYGLVIALGLPALSAYATIAIQAAIAGRLPGGWALTAGLAFEAFILSAAFALQALGRAAFTLERTLRAGKLDLAREKLSWLCSRDASKLDPCALRAASIESLAENASDSVIAPLFWYVIGGLPGVVAYRTINTLDAMWGYRGRFEWLGKSAARLDDIVNFVPARLTALLLYIQAWFQTGARHERTLRWPVIVRDAASTASPNAGWPMAMMAHLLGLRLHKAGEYELCAQGRDCEAGDIHRAWQLVEGACACALLLTGLCLVAT